MITLRLEGDTLHVAAPARVASRIGNIPGLRAARGTGEWTAPMSMALAFQLGNDFPGQLTVDHTVNEWVDRALAPHAPVDTTESLYDYQHSAVRGMLDRKGFLLGDEMGTGKTVMALEAMRHAGKTYNLVVCPNSMKYRWAEEAATWFPGANVIVLDGSTKNKIAQLSPRPVTQTLVIVNWESLRHLTRLAGYGSVPRTPAEQEAKILNTFPWGVVVADEAHRAKDPKAKQTRALWAVSQGATYRWALTGTPVLNTPSDIWSIGKFYDPESYGPSKHAWCNRYVAFEETRWGRNDIGLRSDRKDELHAWFDLNFTRRTKDEVLDLPDITYQRRELDMTPPQRKAYKDFLDRMMSQIDEGIVVADNPLTQILRLQQAASAKLTLDSQDRVQLDTPSCKVTAVLELVDEMGGKPLVVFAQSKKLINLVDAALSKKGIDFIRVTGDETGIERAENVTRFQNGGVPVALCTLSAGGEGINLFAADTLVFMQRSYAYGQNKQAEARVHRNGQTNHVTIIDLVSRGTIDEEVIEVLASKGEMAEQILRDRMRARLRGEDV